MTQNDQPQPEKQSDETVIDLIERVPVPEEKKGPEAAARSILKSGPLSQGSIIALSLLVGFLVAVFIWLMASGGRWPGQQPGQISPPKPAWPVQAEVQPIMAFVDYLVEEGRPVLSLSFLEPMVAEDEILTELQGQDQPLVLSPSQPARMYWASQRDLRVELDLSEHDWQGALARDTVALGWKQEIGSLAGAPIWGIKAAWDPSQRPDSPVLFKESFPTVASRIKGRFELKPPSGIFESKLEGRTVTLTFDFNHDMVPLKQVDKTVRLADSPLSLKPPLALSGSWLSPRRLVFQGTLSPDEFKHQVANQTFHLDTPKDFSSLAGTRFDFQREFSLYHFKVEDFAQRERNIDGWVDFDLTFTQPVTLKELNGLLRARRAAGFPWDDENRETRPDFEETEAQALGFQDDPQDAGLTARLRVKTGPGELLHLDLEGMVSADGLGRLDESPEPIWVDNVFSIKKTEFKVEAEYPWRPYFSVTTDSPINFEHLAKFIRLETVTCKCDASEEHPAGIHQIDFEVLPLGPAGDTVQILADFYSEPVILTLLTGFPAQKGVLTKDVSYDLEPPKNLSRELIFTGRGRYLSPGRPLLVKLAGRNVPQVRLQAWRIHENNLPLLINIQQYDDTTKARLALQLSKTVLDRTVEVDNPSGGAFERLLDLDGLVGDKTRAKGAYLLKISPGDQGAAAHYDYGDYQRQTARYLPVVISDLGLAARSLPERLVIWVTSLSSGRPQPGGLVKIYDRANQVLAEGLTDESGLFSASLDPREAVFATVEKEGDLSYLTLSGQPRQVDGHSQGWSDSQWRGSTSAKWYGGDGGYLPISIPDSAFGPSREPLVRGYEAFVFTPRDLFKPGETMPVKALVRDKNLKPPAEPFPVLWRIIDPDERILSQGRAEMSRQGGLDFALELPFSARTGPYRAEVSLPEAAQALGQAAFTVEDFVPPRLTVNISPGQKIYHGENPEINLSASAEYLFGALGANLDWELDAVIREAEFRPRGWADFSFPGPTQGFQVNRQRRTAQGRLDADGRAELSYRPGLPPDRLPNRLSVELIVGVQEDGGRWNAQRTKVDYYPRDLNLGIKLPTNPAVRQPLPVVVAAVNPEGGAAAGAERIKVRISQVVDRHYSTYRDGRRYQQSVEELIPATEELLQLEPDGTARLEFMPQSAGLYEVALSEADGGRTVKSRFQVYGQVADQTGASGPDRVELSFDRPVYRPGDQARLRVKTPFPGQLWLTVEGTDLLYSRNFQMNGLETEVSIPVSQDIKTNAYVTATMVRPLGSEPASMRAIGVGRLEIDRQIYKLNLAVEKPEKVRPSAQMPLVIKLSDEQGRPRSGELTVALVDEGLLNLSGFTSPDPWAAFTAGRRYAGRFYDLYEQLLPLEKTTLPFLIPGGGEGLSRAGLFSPFKRRQEVLSVFLASVEVGPSGEARLDLDVPEYSGRGRLMVVAASGDRFAAHSQSLNISRDLTAEAGLPLALAPGDSFEISLKAFLAAEASAEAGREANFTLSTEGPLKLTGQSAAQVTLKPGQGHSLVFPARAEPADDRDDRAGLGRLIIESRDGLGQVFKQTLEVAVRPPYPRVSLTDSRLVTESKSNISLTETNFLKGTMEANLLLARSPAIEAVRAVDYLESYPYGCLEQTLSRAWIFVSARDILRARNPEAAQSRHINKGLDQAVKRLATMQTVQGDLAFWPGGSRGHAWGTVYAAHFLSLAQAQIDLPPGLLERSLNWLEKRLSDKGDSSFDLDVKAYALYVLAKNQRFNQGWVNTLMERGEKLSPSGRLFLAGAAALESGDPQFLHNLEEEELDLSLDTMNQATGSYESEARNTALKLLLWSEMDPQAPSTHELALKVAEQGRQHLWRNTQENGWAVLALSSYLANSGVGEPYRVILRDPEGRIVYTGDQTRIGAVDKSVLAGLIGRGLQMEVQGRGRPYYVLTRAGVPLVPPEPRAEGLRLDRTWHLDDKRELPLATPEEMARPVTVKRGQRVVVELVLQAHEQVQNMVLVDILPGGFEIENPRYNPAVEAADPREKEAADHEAAEASAQFDAAANQLSNYRHHSDRSSARYFGVSDYLSSSRRAESSTPAKKKKQTDGAGAAPKKIKLSNTAHLELREDRLVLIEPWLAKDGQVKYVYTLRAVTPGEYQLPGTAVEGMYEPQRQSVLPGGRVIVTD